MRYNYILIFLLSLSFISKALTLTCGNEEIAHCLVCGTGESENRCAQCENNYFPFLFNYMCLPCDHLGYGDYGCQGNCTIGSLSDNFTLTCDEFGCKPGFYSLLKKTCINCNSEGSLNCALCTNYPPEGKTAEETNERVFQCQECINDEYKIFQDGRCHHCSPYHRHCSKCHFPEKSDYSVCDKCDYNYYLSNGKCVKCYYRPIYGGYCKFCTDDQTDYDNINCYCNYTYTNISERSCEHCPNGCNYCSYDDNLKRVKCNYCYGGYTLNSQKLCTYCGYGCRSCYLNRNGNPICSICYGGYDLISGKCYKCPSNCDTCHLDENDNKFICDSCSYYSVMDSNKNCLHCPDHCNSCLIQSTGNLKCTSCYNSYRYMSAYSYIIDYYGLNDESLCQKCPEQCVGCSWKESLGRLGCDKCSYKDEYVFYNDDCLKCRTIPELGSGCKLCTYEQSQNEFKCHKCINRDYAFSSNTYECISNTNKNDTQLYGCLEATYNKSSKKYECNICEPEFIPILNDKNCRLPSDADLKSDCREANNIGTENNPIYSCLRCKWFYNVNVTDNIGVSDCYPGNNDLILCQTATKYENGTIQCDKCLGNFRFIYSDLYKKKICNENCEDDGFKKNYWCYKCEDKYFGNPGCVGEKGCSYQSDNDKLICNECKEGYFELEEGQCFQCKYGDPPCLKCHTNENDKFECDECMDGYFVNSNKKCERITCDEHPEVTPGCIICSDKLSQFKAEGKCQSCKEGYFKTKEGTCVHCNAQKNGGPACELCGYGVDDDGNDTDDIVCKYCPGGFLTSDGKCYKCKDELEDGCQNCTLQVDDIKKTEKLVCTNCFNDYILSNHSHCIHYNSFVKKIPFCSEQYNYLNKRIINENNSNSNSMNITPFEDNFYFYNNTNVNNTGNIRYEYKIESYCSNCRNGYVLKNNTCAPFNIANCSFISIIPLDYSNNNTQGLKNLLENYYRCYSLGDRSEYVKIDYYYEIMEETKVIYTNNNSYYEDDFTDYYSDYPDYDNYTDFNNNTNDNNKTNYNNTNYNNKTNYNNTNYNNKTNYNNTSYNNKTDYNNTSNNTNYNNKTNYNNNSTNYNNKTNYNNNTNYNKTDFTNNTNYYDNNTDYNYNNTNQNYSNNTNHNYTNNTDYNYNNNTDESDCTDCDDTDVTDDYNETLETNAIANNDTTNYSNITIETTDINNNYTELTIHNETEIIVYSEKLETEYIIKNITDNETNYIDDNNDNDTDKVEVFEFKTIRHKFNSYDLINGKGKELLESGQIIDIISKGYVFLSNLGTGDELSPESLRKCKYADYIETNDTYKCTECIEGYVLDEDTNTCKQNIKVSMNLRPGFSNCYVTNIGSNNNPIYSCYRCYNRDNLLVTSDTGAKFCTEKKGELAGCTEVYAKTEYLNNVYNCTDCQIGYISYYNKFFEKITCQNVYIEPEKIRQIDLNIFEGVENVPAIDGQCENNKLFTPDNIHCYACNNRTVGMVGCKGTCKFDQKKNITLQCEEGMCKTGYIEKTRGVCEPCETINEGCIECHYEDNYLNGYFGFKRKRRFSCDQCDTGYLRSDDGTCHHCSTLGFDNCKNCGVDAKFNNEIICVECKPGYFVNNEGKCIHCEGNRIKGNDNTCISCDDVESGGIEGCSTCHNVDNEPQCTSCIPGFILLENNYTCLRISSNVELEELPHCQMVYLNNNNHFICSKCDNSYILLKEQENIKCYSTKFIPTLNPEFCEIFENLGTEDKPKFSCAQCKISPYDDIMRMSEKDYLTRITYKENNTAYCDFRTHYSSLENSTEAVMIIDEEGVKKLNCTECIEENVLHYHKLTDLNICKYKHYEKECVVSYCKTCVPGNNYFCSECLPSNYEVSPLTGACIRKMEKPPAVYFKDIFRFQMNQYKQIGGRMLHGPFLSLRGLTNSQINTGHAFLVLLAFKLNSRRNLRNRNLEEEKNVKTYCQIVESVDESDEANLVDFDCIGDMEEEEEQDLRNDYELNGIKESSENNSNVMEQSNLNDLVEETNLQTLKDKTKTDFALNNFQTLAIFSPNEIKNIISEDYHFDIKLYGKLNKELSESSLDIKLNISQINDKSFDCVFNIKKDKNADIKCDLNLENYKDISQQFSFKVTEVKSEDNNPIYLSRINEVKLIHEEKEEKKYVVVIVVVVVAVVIAAGGTGLGIFLFKRHKRAKLSHMDNTQSMKGLNLKGNEINPENNANVIPFNN